MSPGHSTADLDLTAATAHARRLEEAGFTALLLDDASLGNEPIGSLSVNTVPDRFEPLTLAAGLAMTTERIGLVPQIATEASEPFHAARRLATLDHLSEGRAGWRVHAGPSALPLGGLAGVNRDAEAGRDERTEEFLTILRRLWDSYADDAIVADKRSGLYVRPDGRQALHHEGRYFQVAGPLNVSRSPQGHPVAFHTAANPRDLDVAGRHADVVLTTDHSVEDARTTRTGLDTALAAAGRSASTVQTWLWITPFVFSTESEASAHRDELAASPSQRKGAAQVVAGTPEQIAAHLTGWHQSGVVDGFAVNLPWGSAHLDPFLDRVLPVLRQSGSFSPPHGTTLRDALGLLRPERSIT
jgi:alkanesulfonate monooxygenase SsuD/methylene tetrahydromethanopterin reductase-like flavin-dependent oxidoreductase (luciferase family)